MNGRRTALRALLLVGGLAGAALAAGYLMAKRIPADYRPLTTTHQQNRRAIDALRRTVVEFLGVSSRIGSIDPDVSGAEQARRVRFVVRQRDINRWIASLPPETRAMLRDDGLSRPAIVIGDGKLTVYAHLETVGTIVGIELAPTFDDSDAMSIRVASARLGRLPVPRRLIERHAERIAAELRRRVRRMTLDDGESFGPLRVSDVGHAAGLLIDAVAGSPILLDIPKKYGHARICAVRLGDGEMVLDVVSLLPEPE